MSRAPQEHVFIRDELLYFDGERIHVVGGGSFELQPADRWILERVHRGESEFSRLCERLGELQQEATTEVVAEQLRAVFSDPRSLLELGPAPYVERPDVIVCDFNPQPTPIAGRELVRRLRERRRVLFLGLESRVASTSPDTRWHSAETPRHGIPSWFRFAQWARSIIRYHEDAVLVLLGHQDTILFGDLVANRSSVLVLDVGWPSVTGLDDLQGSSAYDVDLIPNLRALHYALRFSPIQDFGQLTRNGSSALAGMELFAIRNATRVLLTMADQAGELVRQGVPSERLAPACLPLTARPANAPSQRVLLLIADLECGVGPLAPFLTLVASLPPEARSFDRVVLATSGHWSEFVATSTGGELRRVDGSRVRKSVAAVLVFPGLLRELPRVTEWMTSGVPVQIVPSAEPHPLQAGVDDLLILRRVTQTSLAERLSALAQESGDVRKRVLQAQSRLAKTWSIVRRIEALVRAPATSA